MSAPSHREMTEMEERLGEEQREVEEERIRERNRQTMKKESLNSRFFIRVSVRPVNFNTLI